MADTKRGRDRKARRDAHEADLRVLEADVDALRDDSPEPVVYEDDHGDVDAITLVAYLSDPNNEHLSAAAAAADAEREARGQRVEHTHHRSDD